MDWWCMELCSYSTPLLSKPPVPLFSFHPPPLSYTLRTPPALKPASGVSACRRGGKWSAFTAPELPHERSRAMQIPRSRRYSRRHGGVVATAVPASATDPSVTAIAATVVMDFYDGINRRDLASVAPLISEACVFEDLIFSAPFVGRKAIMDFFEKFTESIGSDLQFVIDDISAEDSSAIGVSWHLEWRGRPFPFSKGCSFYRLEMLDGRRQIVVGQRHERLLHCVGKGNSIIYALALSFGKSFGRDCVEPAIKPGEMALVLIRGVTSILKQFPQLADRF